MKSYILIPFVLVLFLNILSSQDKKQYTKVELKDVPELTGFKCSICIIGGVLVAGFDNTFEKALINAGYNKRIKLFTKDIIITYPHKYEKFGYSFELNR